MFDGTPGQIISYSYSSTLAGLASEPLGSFPKAMFIGDAFWIVGDLLMVLGTRQCLFVMRLFL